MQVEPAALPSPVRVEASEPTPPPRPVEVMSPQKRLLTSVEEQFKRWQMPNYHSIHSAPPSPAKAAVEPAKSPPALTALSEPGTVYKITAIPASSVKASAALSKAAEPPKSHQPALAAHAPKAVPVLSPPADKGRAAGSPARGLPALESIQERAEAAAVDKSPKREQPTPEPPQLLPMFGASPSPDKADKMPLMKHPDEHVDDDGDSDEEGEDEERSLEERRRRKASLRRRKTAADFGDESDSQSSTASRRLIIDPSDSSNSASDSDTPTADSELKDSEDQNAIGSQVSHRTSPNFT